MKFNSSLFITSLSLIILFSCGGNNTKRTKSPRKKNVTKIISPKNGKIYKDIDTLRIVAKSKDISIDSIQAKIDGQPIAFIDGHFGVSLAGLGMGVHQLTISTFPHGHAAEKRMIQFIIKPSSEAKKYNYSIVSTMPHSTNDYTQGLFIDDGKIYESTGRIGKSSLSVYNYPSGEEIKRTYTPDQYFGEGIALHDNKIFMLTWNAGKGFVYDKNSFNQLSEFHYNTEGWGLTSMDGMLVMSDGSHILRFMTADNNFNEIKKIEVYDQNGPVNQLNELEYVNGKIYANRYTTNLIYIIDPNTGKVDGVVDMDGLLQAEDITQPVDVLNGIAYDEKKDLFVVTGKLWPRRFLIKFHPK